MLKDIQFDYNKYLSTQKALVTKHFNKLDTAIPIVDYLIKRNLSKYNEFYIIGKLKNVYWTQYKNEQEFINALEIVVNNGIIDINKIVSFLVNN